MWSFSEVMTEQYINTLRNNNRATAGLMQDCETANLLSGTDGTEQQGSKVSMQGNW